MKKKCLGKKKPKRIRDLDIIGIDRNSNYGKISLPVFRSPYEEEAYYERLENDINELRGSGRGW